jgi:hypothetical protein
MSNRTKINNFVIDQLRRIDGYSSPFDPLYNFKANLNTNVYKGLKYLDEINDFPAVYVTSSTEQRIYNTKNNTESLVYTTIRCYVKSDDAELQLNNIIQDIEHIIYSMKPPADLSSLDITIDSILTDSGLLNPYGMAEIFLSSRFEILL